MVLNETVPLKSKSGDVEAAAAEETGSDAKRSGSGRALAVAVVALAAAGLLWSGVVTPGLVGPTANTVASLGMGSKDVEQCYYGGCGEPDPLRTIIYKYPDGQIAATNGVIKRTSKLLSDCGWGSRTEHATGSGAHNPLGCAYCNGEKCVKKEPLWAKCGNDNDCQSDSCGKLRDSHRHEFGHEVCNCEGDTHCSAEAIVTYYMGKQLYHGSSYWQHPYEKIDADESDLVKLAASIEDHLENAIKIPKPEELTTFVEWVEKVKDQVRNTNQDLFIFGYMGKPLK